MNVSVDDFRTDVLDERQRSYCMSKIKDKNTKPELQLRRYLFHLGFRYRLHSKKLPGKPDLVFPKYKTVIFINGCFWHRHGCKYTTTPKSNSVFWEKKFNATIQRDKITTLLLESMGWLVFTIWECEIQKNIEAAASLFIRTTKRINVL